MRSTRAAHRAFWLPIASCALGWVTLGEIAGAQRAILQTPGRPHWTAPRPVLAPSLPPQAMRSADELISLDPEREPLPSFVRRADASAPSRKVAPPTEQQRRATPIGGAPPPHGGSMAPVPVRVDDEGGDATPGSRDDRNRLGWLLAVLGAGIGATLARASR